MTLSLPVSEQPSAVADSLVPATRIVLDIPATLSEFINEQVLKWKFETVADYVFNLIRHHQELMRLRKQLMEGLQGGPSRFFDQEFADELEAFIDAARDLPPPKEWEDL